MALSDSPETGDLDTETDGGRPWILSEVLSTDCLAAHSEDGPSWDSDRPQQP